MTKTFNLYCDESTHLEKDGKPFMIISYIGAPFNELQMHKEHIRMLKAKHKLKGEIKWTNVSTSKFQFYSDLVDYFFSTDLNFRAVIVKKKDINNTIEGFSYQDFYFKMYYQLLHHKISLEHKYNIYIDIKDTCSHSKLEKLKEILKYNASIRCFQFIRSYESSLMQLTDLIMGAVNYKLRDENRVIAKTKLIEKIESHSKVSLTESTYKSANKFNLFFIELSK